MSTHKAVFSRSLSFSYSSVCLCMGGWLVGRGMGGRGGGLLHYFTFDSHILYSPVTESGE